MVLLSFSSLSSFLGLAIVNKPKPKIHNGIPKIAITYTIQLAISNIKAANIANVEISNNIILTIFEYPYSHYHKTNNKISTALIITNNELK